MPIVIHPPIEAKLAKPDHNVTEREIEQCFSNRYGCLLEDTRARHKTKPPTLFFVAPTNKGRLLKIVFMMDGADIIIKSAYEPSSEATDYYNERCY